MGNYSHYLVIFHNGVQSARNTELLHYIRKTNITQPYLNEQIILRKGKIFLEIVYNNAFT